MLLTVSELCVFDYLLNCLSDNHADISKIQPVINYQNHIVKCSFFHKIDTYNAYVLGYVPSHKLKSNSHISLKRTPYLTRIYDELYNRLDMWNYAKVLESPSTIMMYTLAILKDFPVPAGEVLTSNYIFNIQALDCNFSLEFAHLSQKSYELISVVVEN